ncbi:hypothetical protein WR25_10794 [Diploscapter pachys]|uniref:Uncharacterized protein n=1 Tax=Diploscapter pachys TaxID=2018661 RepID=A0A2A2JBW5_9BILA|nr:hypothetical protein WR25_10794 [Diploscapter pachys]
MVYIGIDLGTTYSCVSVIEEEKPVVIISDDGKRTIPSVVAFSDGETLVGNPALKCNTDMANILYGNNQKVIEAVVTVPAMFHPDQIAATKKAIELAGLKLKCLLQEPTAAAIAYNEKKQLGNSKLLVFDFGGGGQDLDSRIMKFVIDEFKRSSPDFDIYKKPKLLKRLRIECREAKESLSFSNNTVNIHLDINDDLEINVRLTKEKFNELCSDLFERAMTFVDRALNMAQLTPEKIDHVILVGGSTRIPKIEQNIKNKFRNSKIQFDINPDEAIAYGAAIVANGNNKTAILVDHSIDELQKKFEETLPINPHKPLDKPNGNKILFYRPDSPEWRDWASVAYFKDKLYYLGGRDPKTYQDTNRVDLLVDGIVERYIDYQMMNGNGLKSESFQNYAYYSQLHH